MSLELKQAESCLLDELSIGECMIRLSPPLHGRLEYASTLEVFVGGGEYNVAYALARYGLRSGWIGKLPDSPLGRLILNHARAIGIDVSEVVIVPYDGVGKKNRVGLNFTEVGTGIRASVTMYDRGHSAASDLKVEDVDWERIFGQKGVRWLHIGGIFTALSETTSKVTEHVLEVAKKHGTIVSYDLNFRSKLWSSEQAQSVTRPLIKYVDCLIGNEEDFQKVLGFSIKGVDEDFKKLPVESYKEMVKEVVATYPNLKVVATTLREVISGLLNNWSAIMYYDGEFYQSRQYKNLEIEDRVGGGDGFSSGLIYGFLKGLAPKDCVEFGAASGALAQSTRGDTTQATPQEIERVIKSGSARIIR